MVFSISCRNRKCQFYASALSFIALACITLSGTSIAQEPTPGTQAPAIKVQVQQVLVPVVVTDRKGHFITDLKSNDFRVFEDDVEQKLTVFTTQQDAAPELLPPDAGPTQAPRAGEPAAPPPAINNAGPRHTYLIVLDTLNSSLAGSVYVREALKKLFKDEQGSDAQYAVVALGRTTQVIQNLTRDPKVVLAALAEKKLSNVIVSSQASNLFQQEIEVERMLQLSAPIRTSGLSKTASQFGDIPSSVDGALNQASQLALERERLMIDFMSNLRNLTEQLSRMPGRRVMILASDGFNMQPGREFFQIIACLTCNTACLMRNPVTSHTNELESVVRMATARNVTIYTLDSRGLYAPPGSDMSAPGRPYRNLTDTLGMIAMEEGEPLNHLAQATGGIYYHNSNDLLKGLRQALADGRSYYELAYYSSNPAIEGKYRAIKVDVKKKNVVIRAKPGYWASAVNIPTIAASTPKEHSVAVTPASAGNTPTTTPTTHAEPLVLQAVAGPSLVDVPTADLMRMVPDLKNLQPAASQDLLASILQKVGSNVATLFHNFPNVTSRERVVEQRSLPAGVGLLQVLPDVVSHDYRYLASPNPDPKQARLKEYRTDAKGHLVTHGEPDSGYMITEGFVSTPVFFDPVYQQESKFRYLGQQVIDKHPVYVVAFAQRPSAHVRERIALGKEESLFVLTQGFAWIDAANYQIVRMWTGLTEPVPEIKLQAQTTRVDFSEVHLHGMDSGLWLPRKVQVEMKWPNGIFRNFHTYSEFKLFTVQSQILQDAQASP